MVFSGGFVGGIIIHADHETRLKSGRIRSTQVYYNMIKPSAAHSKGDGFPGQGFFDPLAAYPANDASIFHGRTGSQLRHRRLAEPNHIKIVLDATEEGPLSTWSITALE